MKRVLSIVLILVLALSITACGGGDPKTTTVPSTTAPITTTAPVVTQAPTTQPAEAPTEAPTQPAEAERDPKLGYLSGRTYINEFVGVQATLNEAWTIADDTYLSQLSGITADAIKDQALAEQLRDSGIAYALFASADDGLVTLNMVIEDLGLLYGTILSEQSYAEMSVGGLKDGLTGMGMEEVTVEVVKVNFAGQEHAGLQVHGIVSGVDFYELLVCVKVDSYMVSVCAASYYENITGNILDLFTAK